MNYLPFPFESKCLLSINNPRAPACLLEVELAQSPEEIFQAFQYRQDSDYKDPIVLLFPRSSYKSWVQSNYLFATEWIKVNEGGTTSKIFVQEAFGRMNKPNPALAIQYIKMVILAKQGFSDEYKVKEGVTSFQLFDHMRPPLIPYMMKTTFWYN